MSRNRTYRFASTFALFFLLGGCSEQRPAPPPVHQSSEFNEKQLESHHTRSIAQVSRIDSGTFESNGTEIKYFTRGSGEPVVLLHGWLGSGQGFIKLGVASTLSEKFQVIAPDLRGHGDSEQPVGEENYGIHFVDDVIQLLDHLGVRKAHFIGYSMGGMILGKLLVEHPDRVKSAVIGGGGGMRDYFNYKFADAFIDAIERGLPTGEALIESLPHLDVPDLDESRESLLELNKLNGKVMSSIPNSWKELEVSEKELRRIEVPVRVLVGTREMPFNNRSAEDLERWVPNCRLVKLKGKTHETALISQEFTSECQSFLLSTKDDADGSR